MPELEPQHKPQLKPRTIPPLSSAEAADLAGALESKDVTVFVDGTSLRLPEAARDAVVDLLSRLADGGSVLVTSMEALLTTSQAAEAAGISHTYLRNLTDAGTIPVEYRGSHRRIRLEHILAWRAGQEASKGSESSTRISQPPSG